MAKFVPNVGNFLTKNAIIRPDRIGFIRGEEQVTWADLEKTANALAAALIALGVKHGDRVAIQCPNNRLLFESMYAIMRTGAAYVPVSARGTPFEIAQMVGLCDAKVLISWTSYVDHAKAALKDRPDLKIILAGPNASNLTASQPSGWHDYAALIAAHETAGTISVPVTSDDIAWHHFTSGTTGVPKGGLNSHGTVIFSLNNRVVDVMPGVDETHATLAIGPIGHGTGTITTVNTMMGAKTVALSTPNMDAEECWRLIQEHKITSLFTVPTILMRLLGDPAAEKYDYSSLRHVILTGAPSTPSEIELAVRKLGDALVQYYGAVEMIGAGTVHKPILGLNGTYDRAYLGSIGIPRSGSDVALLDQNMNPVPKGEVGEVCVRGQGVFDGYYKNPSANAAVLRDGWYRTGDLGRFDEHGWLFLQGRSKEMFKSGGLQVYPNEIQNRLAEHPAVKEAHVLSVPDSQWGEVGIAVVSLTEGQHATEEDLLGFMRERLSKYKIPKRVFVWDDIPRTQNGKVPKHMLREALIARSAIREGEDVR